MQKYSGNKPTMTSTEAAALLLSEGKTSDVDEANLMAEGKLFDPDALERAHFRRMMGFDFTTTHDSQTDRWVIRDEELGLTVSTPHSDNDEINAQRIAKACIKLKAKHDKRKQAIEGEVISAD